MEQGWEFPQAAAIGRTMQKQFLFQRAGVSNALQKRFYSEIDKIIWAYSLKPETVNLPGTENVAEIQVFVLTLKTSEYKPELLDVFDKAIPSHIFFEIHYQKQVQYRAAWKRQSLAEKEKWVVEGVFTSPWMPGDSEKKQLPIALDLEALFMQMLSNLSPLPRKHGEALEHLLQRVTTWRGLQREVVALERKIEKEKQFNRKVELNRQLREVKTAIEIILKT